MNDIELNPQRAGDPVSGPTSLGTDTDAAAYRMSARDLLVQFFYYAKLTRNCVLLGLVIGVIAAVVTPVRYTADTLMLVFVGAESAAVQDASVTGPTVVSIDGLKVVQSEIQIIQTTQVITSAVDRVGPGAIYPALVERRLFGLLPRLDAAAVHGAAIEKFRGDLRVETEPGSNVISISFTHPNRDIAIRCVQAVLDAYLEQRRTIYANTNSSFLDQEIARAAQRMNQLDTQIQALRAHYDVLDLAQDIVLATNRLDGIVQRQNQVRERRVAVATEIVAVKGNLASQPDTVLDFRETTNNTGNDEARNTLVRLEQQHTYLLSQYRPDWPEVKEVEKKIANVQAQMGPRNQNLYFSERNIRNPALELLNNRLASLEVENQALGEQLNELAVQLQQADLRVKSLREADGKLHGLQLARGVAESVFRELSLKQPGALFQDNIVDERNANLRVVQPPTAPTVPRNMMVSYIAGGLFLGLLLGISVTLLATLLRDVFIAPAEAERKLRMPALADIGAAVPIGGEVEIANLAALLQDVTVSGRPLASLQFVGLSEGDGSADRIRALAVELATRYEQKTLLLDLKGGSESHLAALGNGGELISLAGPLRLASTKVTGLWVGPEGTHSIFADPRMSITHLRQAIKSVQLQFSTLLVISASETSAQVARKMGALVDANVVVLRAEHSRSPVVMHLRDMILAGGGNILGFIFLDRKYYVPAWLYRWI
jgi:uncharacterized protein involved in exopolysaccharide biosynthesis